MDLYRKDSREVKICSIELCFVHERSEKNLHSTDWNNVSTAQNFDTAFERFIANLQIEIKVSSEIKTIRRSKRRSSTFKHPWMTPELYQLTEKRRKLLRLSQTQP